MTDLLAAVHGDVSLPPVDGVRTVPWGAHDREPDVVVLAATGPRDLAVLQAVHRAHPEVGAVLLLAAGDAGGVRRALAYTPDVPSDTVVPRPGEDVADLIRDVAEQTARRRRHAAVMAHLRHRPHAPAPSLRPSSGALAAVLDAAPLGVVLLDAQGNLRSWNPRAAAALGLDDTDTGTPLTTLVDEPDEVLLLVDRPAEDGFSPSVTVRTTRTDGHVLEVNAARTRTDDGQDVVLLLLVDVSGRRAAEAARDELRRRLLVVRRSQEFLLRASDVLISATGYVDTLEQLARLAVPTLADLCLIDVVEDGEYRRVAVAHAHPAHDRTVAELREHYAPRRTGVHPSTLALTDGRTHWRAEVSTAHLREIAWDARHHEILRELGLRSYVAVPLVVDGDVLGVVTLMRGRTARRFGEDDVVLAEELAGRVARVVAKARRYDREHEVAVALQRSMLTALPDLGEVEVAARYAPARRDIQVGGDWYDAFVLPGSDPMVIIGDVVGHDLAAAATMGQVRHAMRALAWDRAHSPAAVLTALDRFNAALGVTDFATVVCGVVEAGDAGRRRFRWSNAGHLPPLLVLPDGRSHHLDQTRDIVLGVPPRPGRTRSEAVVDLPAGSTLLLYTDGLVEQRAVPIGEGMAHLQRVVADLAGRPLGALCDGVIDGMAHAQEDDVAVLGVRVP